ncbi:MAG: HAD hydrolase family protein [Acidobacteria bacterium]|nr:HAD hydrolase family protein [Acidobacteriota bacterium]
MRIRPGAHFDLNTVRLIVTDLDGVWTDGSIWFDDWGNEFKRFSAMDGFGIQLGRKAGLAFAILSGRCSACVVHRAAGLGIDDVVQGSGDKVADLDRICGRFGVKPDQTLYMGDDLPDAGAMARAGVSVTVPHAPEALRALAHAVTDAPAGDGALREMVEWVLAGQGRLDALVSSFLAAPGDTP